MYTVCCTTMRLLLAALESRADRQFTINNTSTKAIATPATTSIHSLSIANSVRVDAAGGRTGGNGGKLVWPAAAAGGDASDIQRQSSLGVSIVAIHKRVYLYS